jgi:hypothetical protein
LLDRFQTLGDTGSNGCLLFGTRIGQVAAANRVVFFKRDDFRRFVQRGQAWYGPRAPHVLFGLEQGSNRRTIAIATTVAAAVVVAFATTTATGISGIGVQWCYHVHGVRKFGAGATNVCTIGRLVGMMMVAATSIQGDADLGSILLVDHGAAAIVVRYGVLSEGRHATELCGCVCQDSGLKLSTIRTIQRFACCVLT